jgi:hypothetical protein
MKLNERREEYVRWTEGQDVPKRHCPGSRGMACPDAWQGLVETRQV